MSALTNRYPTAVNQKFTYPTDQSPLNTGNDIWELKKGTSTRVPTDKTLWAETEGDVPEYKKAFYAKHGVNLPPFKESTMAVAPLNWDTGYNDSVSQRLTVLAQKKGEYDDIYAALGVLNTAIVELESLLVLARKTLKGKKSDFKDATTGFAVETDTLVLNNLKADIAATESLVKAYSEQLRPLRSDGQALNQQLADALRVYTEAAKLLGVTDNIDKVLKEQYNSGHGSGAFWGWTGGMGTGAIVAGLVIYGLVSYRRRPDGPRATRGRSSLNLFMR